MSTGGAVVIVGCTDAYGVDQAPALAAHAVWIAFGNRAVLRDASLALQPGTRLALLGRNGAGKTTLLRMLAGLLRPMRGTVCVAGRPFAADANAARRMIGVLGHQSYLYPELTVQENLGFYARLYGVRGYRERVSELLRLVDLYDRRDELAGGLSRGMTQRLALARAIVHDPPILLLDEPDTGLDARAFEALERVLSVQSERVRTVLFTTHDLGHALQLADEVSVLHAGRVSERAAARAFDVAALRVWYDDTADGHTRDTAAFGRLISLDTT